MAKIDILESGIYTQEGHQENARQLTQKNGLNKKEIAIESLIGGGVGGTIIALESTLGYEAMVSQVAEQLTEIGFTYVSVEDGRIVYSGADLDSVTWDEDGEYWDFNDKLNLDSMLINSNLPALIGAGSAFLIPIYAKKKPGLAIAHTLIVGGQVVGNMVKQNRFANLQIYSESLDQTWALQEFATERAGVAGTNPALFYLDEIALGIYLTAIGVTALKLGLDYRKARLPSETVKDYSQEELGVKETF